MLFILINNILGSYFKTIEYRTYFTDVGENID